MSQVVPGMVSVAQWTARAPRAPVNSTAQVASLRILIWSLVVAATASCVTVVRPPTTPPRDTGRTAHQIPAQCFTELGPLNGLAVERHGTLTDACWSPRSVPGEKSAQFFGFTLERSAIVRIDMASSEVDPYLTLWETTPYNPTTVVVESDDDGGDGLASRIHRTLPSGRYTVEVTTYDNGDAGAFQLLLTASAVPDTVLSQGDLTESDVAQVGIDDTPDALETDDEGPDLATTDSEIPLVEEQSYQLVAYGELRFAAGALDLMGATNDFDDFEIEISVSRYDPELAAQADQALGELQANETAELLQEWTSLIRRLAHTSHWELPIALAANAERIPLPYDSGTRSPRGTGSPSRPVAGDSYRTFARYPSSRSEIRFSPVLRIGDTVTVTVIESDPFTPDRLGRISVKLTRDVVAEGIEFSSRYMAMRLRLDPVE